MCSGAMFSRSEVAVDSKPTEHYARVRQMRQSFAEANERLVARLRGCEDGAAERTPATAGWSAAQIGWHVAKVTTRFAGLMSGDAAGVQPLPPDFQERAWADVVSVFPAKMDAPAAFVPPSGVRRAEAISELEAAGMRMAHAFDALTPERGSRSGIMNRLVGWISVYQIGEWATAHVIRHNKQAKEALRDAEL
jgi:hypothetical protein